MFGATILIDILGCSDFLWELVYLKHAQVSP